jgi:hypothetical protein
MALPIMKSHFEQIKSILHYFKYTHIPGALLEQNQIIKYSKTKALLIPATTRWQGVAETINSLRRSREAIEVTILDQNCIPLSKRDRVKYQEIRTLVLDSKF